jgi:hypothetical protein
MRNRSAIRAITFFAQDVHNAFQAQLLLLEEALFVFKPAENPSTAGLFR